ncbi:neprilysin-1-like isoform X2 [Haemaphysalis longicornis]
MLTPSVLLLLQWAVLVCSYSSNEVIDKGGHDVCETPECHLRAQIMSASLDPSVHPCEDFYGYACGGWVQSRTLPPDRSFLDIMQILTEGVLHTLKDILEKIPVVEGKHQNVSDKAVVAYRACLASPKREDTPKPVVKFLTAHGLDKWPIIDGSTKYKTWTEILLNAGISSVLSLYVGKDRQSRSSHIIQIDQVKFSVVGRNQLIHPDDTEYNMNLVEAYKGLIQEVALFIRPKIRPPKSRELADKLVKFEGQLANLTTPPEQRRDISAHYKRVKISALAKDFPNFPLLLLLNNEFKIVNITIMAGEYIEFYCTDYYKKMMKFLEDADTTTFFNYVGLKLLLGVAAFASKGVREAAFALEKVKHGVHIQVPTWRECMAFVNSELTIIAGYFYVQRKFTPHAKQEVEDLIKKLTWVFNKTIRDSNWMDEKTRYHAVQKLLKMKAKIGYPTWLLNTSYLEELGQYIPPLDLKGPYIDIRMAIQKNNLARSLKILREPYRKTTEWPGGPTVVNAFYAENTNEMVFPSAVLQIPYYEYGLPRSLNFGAIGSVVGHEMTHGFDALGSQFDGDGELRNWWSNESRKEFEERAMCFVRQYSKIDDPVAETKLDGYNTVNEDIADNGGLRTAFKAYKKFLKEECNDKDTRLPGLEHLSGKQLFFIANAMIWCSLSTKKELQWRIQYDTHSLNRYRVNVPMKNMKEFSEVFDCKPGTPMNPRRNKTCTLW